MRKKKELSDIPSSSIKNRVVANKKSKSQHSILQRHEMKLAEFSNRSERLKIIDSKIKNLETSIQKLSQELNNEKTKNPTCNITSTIIKHEEKITKFKAEENVIKSGQDEIDYLLESSNIIMEYIKIEEEEARLLNVNDLSDQNSHELNNINMKKHNLVDLYLSKFEPGYALNQRPIKNSIMCENCNILYNVENSFLVCHSCGICKPTVEQANELSYKEMQDFDYRPQFTYDKKSHLEDWLRRFQSKENRSIPQEILDKVILEAQKERISDLNTLTEEKIKRYLKRLSLNDYYDNVIGIINRINGRPPFTLTSEVEDKIKTMFQQIQDPYDKFKPSGRKNFLSYSYTLHKFFQILGLHEFAKYFPLLKSTDKLRQQDDIFKKIVAHMSQADPTTKWVFYPSI
jgi:hypothetical protein